MPVGDDRELVEIAASLVPLATDGCTLDLTVDRGVVCLAASHVEPGRERDLFDPANRGAFTAMSRCAIVCAGERVGELVAWSAQPLTPLAEALVCSAAGHVSSLLDARALRHRAKVAEVERSSIIAMVGHEVRAPLQTLTVGLELLQMRIRDTADEIPRAWLTVRCAQLSRSVARLTDVATRLLDVSRHEADDVTLESSEHDLVAIADDVVARVRKDADWAGSPIVVRESGELSGRWDRLHVETILENLLTNAFKYGAGSQVEVTLAGDETAVTIDVHDHGTGIKADELPHVFDRFFRGDSSGRHSGLGIGLWIVKRLVEAHDGSIHCESTPDTGTTFRVQLPRNLRASDWARERSRSHREDPAR